MSDGAAATRRSVLGVAAASLLGRPAPALAAGEDSGPLGGLIAYQQEVSFGYRATLLHGPFERSGRELFRRFLAESEQAVAALRKALEDAGGAPPPPPDAAKAPPPADPSRHGYLSDLITAESLAAGAYYRALQNLQDARHLSGAAAFMTQAGRHLVALRRLDGRAPLPRAFETGRS